MVLLNIKELCKYFGGLAAVNNVSFDVNAGKITSLIGPNGAGKTTLFNCVTGFCPVTSGSVRFNEQEITTLSSDEICRIGCTRTFQIVKSFRDMTVLENVVVGALCRTNKVGVASKKALELLELTGLAKKKDVMSEHLTIADKKRLELTRALATEPKLIMLDEVAAGLNPQERNEVVKVLQKINREANMTILLIEHVMDVVIPISDHIVVMNEGIKIAEGLPEAISRNEEVIKAYLGVRYYAKSAKH